MSSELCKSIREKITCSWKCMDCEKAGAAETVEPSVLSLLEAMNAKMRKESEDRENFSDKMLASLKSFETAVAKRVDVIEETQMKQGKKLDDHDETLKNQSEKINELEDRETQNIDVNHLIDKAATEMAEREKRSRNFLVHQLTESDSTSTDEILNDDRRKVESLVSDVTPRVEVVRLFRIGQPRPDNQKPRSILVITAEADQARAVVNASFAKTLSKIPGTKDIHCTKDRSLNQRLVLGKINATDADQIRSRGRGTTRGRGRPRGSRGRGSNYAAPPQGGDERERDRSDSRKRQRETETAVPAPLTKKSRATSGSHPTPPPLNPALCSNDTPASLVSASEEAPSHNETTGANNEQTHAKN